MKLRLSNSLGVAIECFYKCNTKGNVRYLEKKDL